jgi:hypothetical protein
LHAAHDTIEQSRRLGRVKYQVLGLEIQAKALAGCGQKRAAMTRLQRAVALARPTGDPAMVLRPLLALLALEDDEGLLRAAQAYANTMQVALPDAEWTQRFLAAEQLRTLV